MKYENINRTNLKELCSGGSDWRTVKLKQIDLQTGDTADLDDVLEHVKFSPIAWSHDNKV